MEKMKRNIQALILSATVLAMASSCSSPPAKPERRLQSWSEVEADIVLQLAWSSATLGISQTNKLGFKWTESKNPLLSTRALGGAIADWHGTGMLRWSLSPVVATNGVNVTLECRWRDSKSTGETNTTFLVPFQGGIAGGTNGFVYSAKWIEGK